MYDAATQPNPDIGRLPPPPSEQIDGQTLAATGLPVNADRVAGGFVALDFGKIAPPLVDAAQEPEPPIEAGAAGPSTGGSTLNPPLEAAEADTFVIDPSALNEFGLVDVITDYNLAQGDVLDLGSLLNAAFGINAPTNATEANAAVNLVANGGSTDLVIDMNGTLPDGEIVIAQLSGVYTAVNILYVDGNEAAIS